MEGTNPPGALLRVLVWLGLEQHQSEWARSAPGGEVAVFAETYENNVIFINTHTHTELVTVYM